MAVVTCGAVYALKHPLVVSPLYGVAMGALFAVVLQVARAVLIEREYTVCPFPLLSPCIVRFQHSQKKFKIHKTSCFM